MIRVVIPDPDPASGSWFFTLPGSRGQKGTGSRIRIRNTGPTESWTGSSTQCLRFLICSESEEEEVFEATPPPAAKAHRVRGTAARLADSPAASPRSATVASSPAAARTKFREMGSQTSPAFVTMVCWRLFRRYFKVFDTFLIRCRKDLQWRSRYGRFLGSTVPYLAFFVYPGVVNILLWRSG